jgi:cytochrome c-type biogenesis protein CcmH
MIASFVGAAALFCVIVLALIAWPLLRRHESDATASGSLQSAAQSAALRDAAATITADLAAARIDGDEANARRKELLLRARAEASEATTLDAVDARASLPHRRTAVVLSLAVALGAAGLYSHLGRVDGLAIAKRGEASPNPRADMASQMGPEQIAAMVARLEARLSAAPPRIEDLKAWNMLGRSQMMLGKPDKAAVAYRTVLQLSEPTAEAEINLAEALLVGAEGKANAEAKQLLASAYSRSPKDQKVLWLNAAAAQEAGDRPTAVKFLKDLIATVPPGSDEATQVQQFITDLSK